MTLSPLPELLLTETPLPEIQQRLLALRQSLQRACNDLDLQLAALAPATAPLNASRPLNPGHESSAPLTGRLFETPPTGHFRPNTPKKAEEPHSRVFEAATPGDLAPHLEQATLAELNSALSLAFAQVALKRG